jgi:hypothetical protein
MAEEEKKEEQGGENNSGKKEEHKEQGNMIPKVRLDQEISKRKAAEDSLKEIAESLKSSVPEEFQELVPDLPPAKLVSWIQQANQKGLFEKKTVEALDKKRPGDKQPQDFSGLSPQQMMSRGYKT